MLAADSLPRWRALGEGRSTAPDDEGWRPPRGGAHPPGAGGGLDVSDMGAFGRALRAAGFVDSTAVQLAGAMVWLPAGMRSVRRFRARVRAALDGAGLEECEYPLLNRPEVYAPEAAFFDLGGRLMGVDVDLAGGGPPRAVLSPTGEATIYTHWADERAALPRRIYQCARYFRPAPSGRRSGRGPFRPIESADVFEVHCGHRDAEAARAEVRGLLGVLGRLADGLPLPVIWSRRPPWGNHGGCAEQTFGGDVWLPAGKTVQVGCVYDQGSIFARAFGLEGGDRSQPARIVTAAFSRRALLAHCMLSLAAYAGPAVHPRLAPWDVELVAAGDDGGIGAALAEAGLRVRVIRTARGRALGRALRAPMHAPLRVVSGAGRRSAPRGAALVRGDDGAERRLPPMAPGALAEVAARVIDGVGARVEADLAARARGAVQAVGAIAEADAVVEAGRVARLPLVARPEATAAVEAAARGEVIGFVRDEPARCAHSGAMVESRALLARRV